MGALVSLIFAVLAALGFAAAFVTGSGRALALGVVAFCIWKWLL